MNQVLLRDRLCRSRTLQYIISDFIQSLLLFLEVLLKQLFPLVIRDRGGIATLIKACNHFLQVASNSRYHFDVFLIQRGNMVLCRIGGEVALVDASLAGISSKALGNYLIPKSDMIFLTHLKLKLKVWGRRQASVNRCVNTLLRFFSLYYMLSG